MTPELAAQALRCAFPLGEIQFAASGDPEAAGEPILRGHAAVFNRLSHDLGGFRVKISPGAFTDVLHASPDVHLVWDHDTRLTLARTTNNTLELREDPYGLHVWARLAKTSYADDLGVLMRRGDIDQMSFMFDPGADEWHEDGEGNITWTIHEVENLYDVTVCAQGAFPQTDSRLAANAATLASAIEAGRVEGHGGVAPPAEVAGADDVADEPGVEVVAPEGDRIAAARARARAAKQMTTTQRS